MRRLFLLAGIAVLLQAHPLEAQEHPAKFERWNPRALALEPVFVPQSNAVRLPRRDYRYEGLAIGGIALGALGAWVGSRITEACPTEPGVDCEPDRLGNGVALGLMAGAIGGGLGYLVGRLSAKPEPALESAEPRPYAPR